MQAVEIARITVQLRRLANSSRQESAASPFSAVPSQASVSIERPITGKSHKKFGRASSSMSVESMRSVMYSLRSKHKPSAVSSSDARDGLDSGIRSITVQSRRAS